MKFRGPFITLFRRARFTFLSRLFLFLPPLSLFLPYLSIESLFCHCLSPFIALWYHLGSRLSRFTPLFYSHDPSFFPFIALRRPRSLFHTFRGLDHLFTPLISPLIWSFPLLSLVCLCFLPFVAILSPSVTVYQLLSPCIRLLLALRHHFISPFSFFHPPYPLLLSLVTLGRPFIILVSHLSLLVISLDLPFNSPCYRLVIPFYSRQSPVYHCDHTNVLLKISPGKHLMTIGFQGLSLTWSVEVENSPKLSQLRQEDP